MRYELRHYEWHFDEEPKSLMALGFQFERESDGWRKLEEDKGDDAATVYIEFKGMDEFQEFVIKFGPINIDKDLIYMEGW